MYSMRRAKWLWAVALCTSLEAQISRLSDSVTFSAESLRDTLSAAPLIQGSWQLFGPAGEPLDTAFVRVDALSGAVAWIDSSAPPQTVLIRYQVFEGLSVTTLGPAWRYLPPLEMIAGTDSVTRHKLESRTRQGSSGHGGQLVSAGSLFRGLSLTTGGGVKLTGGLRLQLQGELAPGIFINGSVTDQNLPIQPQGNTRTLNELDQIRLALTSRWGVLEMGDITLRSRQSRLLEFDRKLEGMQVRLDRNGWKVEAALGSTPGRYRSQSFPGEFGRQGPYALTSDEGLRSIIVVAGTERVWLNGELLQRGEGFDYTIDYNTGEVSFNPRHPLRSDSRIVVDFEYTDLVYDRTSTFLATSWQGERSTFTVTAFSERDHVQSNLDFSLSTEDQLLIEQLGDREEDALVSTAVPDSAGNYDLVDGHYVWRGAGLGDHTVSFFKLGARGEYRRTIADGKIIYLWVAPGERGSFNATYAPFRVLKFPRQKDLLAAGWHFRSRNGEPLARLDLGLSNLDLNSLSSLDDGDNVDGGYAARVDWRGQPLSLAGRQVRVGARYRSQGKGERFRPAGRWDAVEFRRDWDLDRSPQGYRWQTVNLFLEQADNPLVFAELGRLVADTVLVDRLLWGVNRVGVAPLTAGFSQRIMARSNSSRRHIITTGDLKYNINSWSPFIRYYGEDRELGASPVWQVAQWEAGIRRELAEHTRFVLSREWREDVFQTGNRELAQRWLVSMDRSVARGRRFSLGLSFNQKQASDGRPDLSYLMGTMSLVSRPRGRPWWLDARYRLERKVVETKVVVYDSVGTGAGRYRYDPVYQSYVPDEAGVYARYYLPAGVVRPVNAVASRFRLQTDLNRLRHMPALVRGLKEARLIVLGRLTAEAEENSLLPVWQPALADSTLLGLQSQLQMDLAIQARSASPRVRFRVARAVGLVREGARDLDRGLPPGEAHDRLTVDLGRVSRHRLGRQSINMDLRVAFERRLIQSQIAPQRNHDIRKQVGSGTLSGALWGRLTASLKASWQQEEDLSLGDLQVRTMSYGLGLQRAIGARDRLRIDLERFEVAANRTTALPLLLAEGFPRGGSWQLRGSGQFHLSGNLLLSLTLFSRHAAGRTPITHANVELRTQF